MVFISGKCIKLPNLIILKKSTQQIQWSKKWNDYIAAILDMSASWAVLLVSYLKLSMIIILATFLRSIYFCEKEEEFYIKFFKGMFFNTAPGVCSWLDVLTTVSLDFIIACVFIFLYVSCGVIDDMEKILEQYKQHITA